MGIDDYGSFTDYIDKSKDHLFLVLLGILVPFDQLKPLARSLGMSDFECAHLISHLNLHREKENLYQLFKVASKKLQFSVLLTSLDGLKDLATDIRPNFADNLISLSRQYYSFRKKTDCVAWKEFLDWAVEQLAKCEHINFVKHHCSEKPFGERECLVHFRSLAVRLVAVWYPTGQLLGLEESDLDSITCNSQIDDPSEKPYQMFLKWQATCDCQANVNLYSILQVVSILDCTYVYDLSDVFNYIHSASLL